MVAFLIPMLFVAMHWYKPLSTRRRLLIVRLPDFTSVLLAGKDIITLTQVTLGDGNPSDLQVSCIEVNSIFVTRSGGALVKIGRPERRKEK